MLAGCNFPKFTIHITLHIHDSFGKLISKHLAMLLISLTICLKLGRSPAAITKKAEKEEEEEEEEEEEASEEELVVCQLTCLGPAFSNQCC